MPLAHHERYSLILMKFTHFPDIETIAVIACIYSFENFISSPLQQNNRQSLGENTCLHVFDDIQDHFLVATTTRNRLEHYSLRIQNDYIITITWYI
jgi:hypothetical protein